MDRAQAATTDRQLVLQADAVLFQAVGNSRVQDKAERIAAVNQAGSVPAPLVSAKMFDFGDAVVMIGLHQPVSGKPIHVSRVWIKRDGVWQMAISYQTTQQAAPEPILDSTTYPPT